MKNQSTYIAFLCHIVSIQVDKQACLDIFKPDKSCIYPLTLNSACLMKSTMKRSGFWVSNIEISRTPQKLHFRMTKKDPCLPFHFHVLNLFKSWSNLGFDQYSNGHKIKKIDKIKNQSTYSSYVI